ncbi:MAG: hypothetical protein EPN93_10350 [Spirochaetes bacterium]|nr:MAG: hypothetical protein EPN93_10350 [Spirochaetota bacterium]
MRKTLLFMVLAACAAMLSCGTVDQNIRARKNIEKCKFELNDLKLNRIEFNGIAPKQADFDLFLKITNPTEDDVVLDRVEADIYLDRDKTTSIEHKKFLRLKGKDSAIEKIDLSLPASALFKLAGKRPETVTVDAKVFVNILIGSFTLETSISVPVKKTFPIPWDKIDAEIDTMKGGAVDKAEDKARDLKKDIKKKFR